jgi:hypothetical protein
MKALIKCNPTIKTMFINSAANRGLIWKEAIESVAFFAFCFRL